jgi:cytochrome c oxidase subunit II
MPVASMLACCQPLSALAGPQSVLAATGDQARAIEDIWYLMLWILGSVYALVVTALGAVIWRKARALRMAGQVLRSERALSLALLAWVALVVGLLTWLVMASYWTDRQLHAGKADLTVRIVAKQWWWQVEYLDPEVSRRFITANELHLPRGRTIKVELEAADVIHSFWVPALSGKEDLIPGYRNSILLTPRVAGRYRGQCAEFCGLQHAHMAIDVQVQEPAEFSAWQARQLLPAATPSTPGALAGARVFMQGACSTCHTVRGTAAGSRVGPDLTHLASRRTLAAGALPLDRASMAAWLTDPQHPKPGNRMPQVPLQPQELAELTDYLMELR